MPYGSLPPTGSCCSRSSGKGESDVHVALLCPYSLDVPGGVGTHVLGLATWLAARGDQVTVIAPGTRRVSVSDGVSVRLMGRSVNLPFNGSVAQLAVLPRQCRAALRAIDDADVVHVHEPLTPGIAFAAARGAENLVVTHHASFTPSRILTTVLRRRAAALPPRVAVAVSVAAQQSATVTTGSIPQIIGNGVLLPDPPPECHGWRGGDRPRIAFLGRLDEARKGFPIFRAVAERAREAGMDADFVALGPGRAAPGPVRLWGVVDDDMLTRTLQQVDVLLAPNLFGESFGLILVEALAAGCSVVASDLPGFVDVLATSRTGRTFPRGDVDAALAAIQSVVQIPEDPVLLHKSARPWSWDVLGPLVREQYSSAVRKR